MKRLTLAAILAFSAVPALAQKPAPAQSDAMMVLRSDLQHVFQDVNDLLKVSHEQLASVTAERDMLKKQIEEKGKPPMPAAKASPVPSGHK